MRIDHPIAESLRRSAMWEALGYPGSGHRPVRTVGLGTLLAPTVLVPLGYVLQVMRRSRDRSRPPPLELDETILIDGGIGLLVGTAYLAPGLIAWLAGKRVIGLGIALIAVYLLPAAFVRVARGAIPDGFRLGTLLDLVLTEPYVRAWLGTATIGGTVLALLGAAWLSDPVLAVVPALGCGFVGPVVLARRHVLTYDRLLRVDAGASPEADATGVSV